MYLAQSMHVFVDSPIALPLGLRSTIIAPCRCSPIYYREEFADSVSLQESALDFVHWWYAPDIDSIRIERGSD